MSTQTPEPLKMRASFTMPFQEAVERVKQALKDEGFGTLTEVNVKETLRQKIGAEIENYTILGVCNPRLASRAIAAEHEVGFMLPCGVLVHECGGQVHVLAQDPAQMVDVMGNSALEPIAHEAQAGIARAINSLPG